MIFYKKIIKNGYKNNTKHKNIVVKNVFILLELTSNLIFFILPMIETYFNDIYKKIVKNGHKLPLF